MRLDRDQQLALVLRSQAGDASARGQLILANMGLVHSIVRRVDRHGLADADDLVQVGRIAINHAIDKFDPSHGTPFGSYAAFWIIGRVQREIAHHLPVSLGVGRTTEVLFSSGALDANAERLAIFASCSLDMPVAEGAELTHADFLRDDAPGPEERLAVEEYELRRDRAVRAVLGRMPARMAELLRRRCLAEEPETLNAIGEPQGLSRERIRQLEVEAKARFRKLAVQDAELMSFVDQQEPQIAA